MTRFILPDLWPVRRRFGFAGSPRRAPGTCPARKPPSATTWRMAYQIRRSGPRYARSYRTQRASARLPGSYENQLFSYATPSPDRPACTEQLPTDPTAVGFCLRAVS